MSERKRKYTEKENRRRYHLHYKARRTGAEICTAEKTCKVPIGKEYSRFVQSLADEFHYGIQYVITPPRMIMAKY